MTSIPAPLYQVAELARSVTSALDLETVLSRVTAAVQALRPDLRCVIRLVDGAAGGYRLAAAGGTAAQSAPAVVPFGTGLTHVVAETGHPLLLLDAGRDPRAAPEVWAGVPGLTVYYGVPITAAETRLGVLNVLFPMGAPPSDDERHVIDLFAGHAAVAIRNARLFTESEARRRVAEALADVGHAFAQSLDPRVVGQRIADSLRALLQSQLAVLYGIQGESGDLVSVAVSGVRASALGPAFVIPGGTGVVGLAVREGRTMCTADVLEDPRVTLPPVVRAHIVRAGHRAVCAVPLAVKDRVIGALGVGDRAGRLFSGEEIRLVQAFADQAALALDNARLYQESERRRSEAELLAELVRRITASPDLDTILQRVVEGARELVGSDLAHIALREPESGAMIFRYWAGVRYQGRQAYRVELGRGLGGRVLLTGRPCRTANYAEDSEISKDFLPTIRAERIVASMAVPIRVGDRLEGLLFVDNREPRAFSDRDEVLLLRLADHAAVAITNARILARERAAREDAEAANRAKDEFLATVSHELRTPLNAIVGWAQVLQGGKRDEAMLERGLETIARNARVQARLIDDLLDVSRIITGQLRMERRTVDLVAVIEGALDAVRPASEAKRLRLEARLDPEAGLVSGDAARLQQVVWNLLSNAVKFTPPHGRVEVTLSRVDGEVEVRVGDTGQGIKPEFLPHVFERFRQADSTTTRTHSGLGLGLAIARHLVELHGGTVSVASEGEGLGATFSVRLPRHAALLAPAEARGRPGDVGGTAAAAPLQGLRVLLVDDEADTREIVTTLLRERGVIVIAVATVHAAVEALRQARPDLLVSDIAMPGEDGYALLRWVRRRDAERGLHLPAVALTAYARPEDRERAIGAGFDRHLPKPVDPVRLTGVVAELTGRAAAGGAG